MTFLGEDMDPVVWKAVGWAAFGAAGLGAVTNLDKVDGLRAQANDAWSMAKLATISRAALLYCNDHDDRLPAAPGNFAYSSATKAGFDCASIDQTFGDGCAPVSELIIGYGLDKKSFESPSDKLTLPDEKAKTWAEFTETKTSKGSSYEYYWHRNFVEKPYQDFKNASTEPLFVTLFEVTAEDKKQFQVGFMDGHVGTMTRHQLEQLGEPK